MVTPEPYYADDLVTLYHGDCIEVMRSLPDCSVDAVVTDPPYGLEFMGREWDGADGFRRSLNPADAGRESVFGRTARTSPEYRALHTFQEWCEQWAAECLRVLKPGGHLLAFGGTRTYHRLACAVEDVGFEIRDSISWLYGSGFPKSLDVSKAIDKAARGVPHGGADPTSPNHGNYRTSKTEGRRWDGDSGQSYGAGGSRFLASTAFARTDARDTETDRTQAGDPERAVAAGILPTSTPDATATDWQGWGTALKPAHEPIVVARKGLVGTVAQNVLTHGTGALNIDACRIDTNGAHLHASTVPNDMRGGHYGSGHRPGEASAQRRYTEHGGTNFAATPGPRGGDDRGRWPANVVLDESQAAALDEQSGETVSRAAITAKPMQRQDNEVYGKGLGSIDPSNTHTDQGGASRFFYVAKAGANERVRVNGTAHPTVKPLALMRWLVRLVTPPGGVVLEPFAGSGTTAEACVIEGFRCIAIEREPDYLPLIVARLSKPIECVLDFGEVSA